MISNTDDHLRNHGFLYVNEKGWRLSPLYDVNPSIDNNIFSSMNNINLNCVLGTKKDGKYTSFLDNYDNK